MMHRQAEDPMHWLRLLEAWLPLAQALNEEFQWRAEPRFLEQIVRQSAERLTAASNLGEARATLYHTYQQNIGENV